MTNAHDTIRSLAEITDAGLFERLATAVLRSSNPEVYCNLSHPGVNAFGKTVKAPLDNIGWIRRPDGDCFVGAAHSTCEAKDIFGKWLHDPSTVRPRTPTGKPTGPEGDLRKAIREISVFRADRPNLQAIFSLTSNREPDQESVVAAQKLATEAGIDLDIWSASRLAHYLDNTAEGQWLRRTHLNEPVNLLSTSLLQHCARRQLNEHCSHLDPSELIERNAPAQQVVSHTLLIGPSGIGKTTLALQMLKEHLDAGGMGMVITHEALVEATSLAEAIDKELRKLEPHLEEHAGHRALAFATSLRPFLVLLEDGNRASDPPAVFNKILNWAVPKSASVSTATYWRLICPIWPRYLESLDQALKPAENMLLHALGVYSDLEAADAVRRRAMAIGSKLLPGEITSIAQVLGNDPLLIALHDFASSPNAASVVDVYVDKELAKVASIAPDLMHSELSQAVNQLAREMLLHRNLAPSWLEISAWLCDEPLHLKGLRSICKAGSVLRLQQHDGVEVLMPRHDRVLLALLSRVMVEDLREDRFNTTYLADPFFAEAVGTAALSAKLGHEGLKQLMRMNPLALFYAFQLSVRSAVDKDNIVLVLRDWLNDEATHSKRFQTVRLHALRLLSEIDAPEVLLLTESFRNHDRFYDWYRARFRNREFVAGVSLLSMHDFGVNYSGQQILLEHVFARDGEKITDFLRDFLARTDLSERVCKGALYLAGYLGDPALASAIDNRWTLEGPDKHDLMAYLWAAARCYDGSPKSTLALVCDEWAALPDKDEAGKDEYSRTGLAAYEVSWEFKKYLPTAAIPYFVQRAQSDPRLTWPITYMLRSLDHPAAAEYIARYMAEHDDSLSSHFLLDDWSDRRKQRGQMSNVTKKHLFELSLNGNNELSLRKAAFRSWEVVLSPADLKDMDSIGVGHDLYEKAIWARARRGDKTVIPELLIIIPTNPRYWWQTGRYLWSSEMTHALHKSIQNLVAGNKPDDDCEWILSELLMELDGQSAERILVAEWEGLKTSPRFVQAALYHCSPRLIELAKSAIAQAADPKVLLEHVTMHMGWKTTGRKGINRFEQVALLASYADLLSEHDLSTLMEICNEQGWAEIRNRYLDAKIEKCERLKERYISKVDLSALDRSVEGISAGGLHFWADTQINRGKSPAEVKDALFDWFQNHMSLRGLEIVSEIFQVSGDRQDLEKLKQYTDSWPEATDIMVDLAFSIQRRTLQ